MIRILALVTMLALVASCATVPPHLCATGFIFNSSINCGKERGEDDKPPQSIVVSPTFQR